MPNHARQSSSSCVFESTLLWRELYYKYVLLVISHHPRNEKLNLRMYSSSEKTSNAKPTTADPCQGSTVISRFCCSRINVFYLTKAS